MNLRLVPPLLEVSPELLWVLARAFAPLPAWAVGPVDPQRVWELAKTLDLACRIGWRVPRAQLEEEIGGEVAGLFAFAYHNAATSAVVINAVAAEVVQRLHRAGVACVLLKSNALTLAGITALGARRCTDVDVLVPAARGEEARRLLLAEGYSRGNQWDGAHQLSSVFHPSGVMVEVHSHVKHMRLQRGGGWVSFEDLQNAGHLRPLATFPAVWVPSPAFLAGHALIHGLVHHWRQVGDYPLLRLVGDLEDLSKNWQDEVPLAEAVLPWLAAEGVEAEGRAALEVLHLLAAGGGVGAGDGVARLGKNLFVRHAVASLFDQAYGDAVRAAGSLWVDTNRSPTVALARKVRNRLFLTDGSMARRYGPTAGRLGRGLLRLGRPLELAGRLLVLLRRYARYRWQGLERRSIQVGRAAVSSAPGQDRPSGGEKRRG